MIYRTETQMPITPPMAKDTMFNVTQAAVYLGFVVLLVGAVVSCMKWLDSKLEKLGVRFTDELKDVKADVKAAEVRILDTEKATVALDKRLLLQEQESRNIKDSQLRMEQAQKDNHKEVLDRLEIYATSIREVRDVALKTKD